MCTLQTRPVQAVSYSPKEKTARTGFSTTTRKRSQKAWKIAKKKINRKKKGTFLNAQCTFMCPRRYDIPEQSNILRPRLDSENNREYIDTGASVHMMCRKSLTLGQKKTANELVQSNEESQIYINDLDIYLCVKNWSKIHRRCHAGGCSVEKWATPFLGNHENHFCQQNSGVFINMSIE